MLTSTASNSRKGYSCLSLSAPSARNTASADHSGKRTHCFAAVGPCVDFERHSGVGKDSQQAIGMID